MRKLLVVSAALMAMTGVARAADLAPSYKAPPMLAPVFSWTGFYIGGHVGYGWSNSTATVTQTNFPGFDVAKLGNNASGVVGGGQVGYNWQFAPNWLLGIEGDISGAGLHATTTAPVTVGGVPIPAPGFNHEAERNIDWMASIRGRLGFTSDRWLVYVTGGGAWADLNYRTNLTGFGLFNSTSFNKTQSGWTAGGGVEYAVTNNWTIRAEYLYYAFGNTTVVNVAPLVPIIANNTTWNNKVNVVRAGVNYKF